MKGTNNNTWNLRDRFLHTAIDGMNIFCIKDLANSTNAGGKDDTGGVNRNPEQKWWWEALGGQIRVVFLQF